MAKKAQAPKNAHTQSQGSATKFRTRWRHVLLIDERIRYGEPYLIEAFCYRSQTNKQFRQRRILDVRDQEWSVAPANDGE